MLVFLPNFLRTMNIRCNYSEVNATRAPNIHYWNDKKNIIQFLTNLQQKLNLQTTSDWNSITKKQIQFHGGSTLLQKYSLYEVKCMGKPEGKSMYSAEPKLSRYWNNQENIQNFLKEIQNKFNLNTAEDWNSITKKQIQNHGGNKLLDKYSLIEIKTMGFPIGKSLFTKSSPKKHGYWNEKENILNFLKKLQEKYNLKSLEDWNLINYKQIQENGGATLLEKHSLYDLKCLACPEGKNYFTKTKQIKSPGYWHEKENIIQFLQELSEKLNLKTANDWNSLTKNQIKKYGGRMLFKFFTLYEIKCLGFPEGKLEYDVEPKSSGFWQDKENILHFLEKLKEKLNIKTNEDWNLVSRKQIIEHGGGSLFVNFSLYDLKLLSLPDHKNENFLEKPKSFTPSSYWNDKENINEFLNELKEKLNLNSSNDWIRLSKHQIRQHGGNGLLKKLGKNSLFDIFNQQKLDININHLHDRTTKRSSQRWLFLQVQKLFPDDEIIEDYFHSEISRCSGFAVQFDIFLIQRNIAFEYHGEQHYEDIPSAFATIELYNNRDKEKTKLCEQFGIKLIVIPYWWDNRLDSLQTTINKILNK